ncbi:gp038 (endogenous virus) [Lactococcus phage KSY1]|uniref:Gp038 n=1 Tax=Lactococcus phage KSY1 TaxID=2913972 RepID=A6MAA2_9CAUD|nr:gp038 [Lactococcus phage KSY1]ABG21580.1 gp038 [Lactococcus phage KSY1]
MSKYDYTVDINNELVEEGRQGSSKTRLLVGAAAGGLAVNALAGGASKVDKHIESEFHHPDNRQGGFGDFLGGIRGIDPIAGFKGDYSGAKQASKSSNYLKANKSRANNLNVDLNPSGTLGGPTTQQDWKDADQMTNLAQTGQRRRLQTNTGRTATQGQANVDNANIQSQVGAQNALNNYNSTSTLNNTNIQNAQLGFDSTNYRNTANSNIASNNYDSTTAQNSAKAAGAMNSAGVDMFKQVASAYDPNAVGTDGVAGGALPDITSALEKGANAQTQLAQSNANALGTRNSAYNLAESSNAVAYGGMNSDIQSANTGTAKAYGTMNSINSAHNTYLANAQTGAIQGNLNNALQGYDLDDSYNYGK